MTPQEQQMIDGLIQRIRSTQVTDKDVDAEQHLQQGLAGYPDAIYVLAQTVLVQEYGLNQAQQRIQELQSALDEARQHAPQSGSGSGSSFLSKIFGSGSSAPQGGAPTQSFPGSGAQYQPVNAPGYPPPPAYASPAYGGGYAPGYGQPMGFGGGGGFLRGALQTAAGVAAGAMVFEGVESLFHGFGGGGGGHETIVNNYYDDPGAGGEHHGALDSDSSFYNPSGDASRQGLGEDSSARGFADTGSDGLSSQSDDSGFNDDTGAGFGDDAGSDSGLDDTGGGFDDGGFGSDDDSGF
ncbi:MAG TPA: DUF2076 domain-containing protein [Acidobacteriaceae bacterium]|nr:DUF2076 domain-containing protein [Acidobacteriaceae bacterium]